VPSFFYVRVHRFKAAVGDISMSFDRFANWGAAVGLLCTVMHAGAQSVVPERIYRCGHEYTNAPLNPQNCEVLQGQNITVIQGTRPVGASLAAAGHEPLQRTKSAPVAALNAPAWGAAQQAPVSTEPVSQSYRDAQKRAILVTELRQVRERHAQLVQDYNQGEADKIGGEARNHQKYLDRMAQMKAQIARAERDMDSLQKELARLPSTQVAQP